MDLQAALSSRRRGIVSLSKYCSFNSEVYLFSRLVLTSIFVLGTRYPGKYSNNINIRNIVAISAIFGR